MSNPKVVEQANIAVIDGEGIADVSPWEFGSVTEEAGNGFTLDAVAKIHGSKGYLLTFGGSNDAAYGTTAFGDQNNIYSRQYIRIASWIEVSGTDRLSFPFLLDGGTNLLYLNLYLRTGTSNIGAKLYFRHNAGETAVWDQSAATIVTVGPAFYVDVHYLRGGIGTGGYSLWINGVLKSSNYATYDTSNYIPDIVRAGTIAGSVAPSTGTKIHFDDILLSTVGPIGEYSILPWQVFQVEEDLLPEISASGTTALGDYEISALNHVQIADYRGVNKHYNLYGLLLGEEAEL